MQIILILFDLQDNRPKKKRLKQVDTKWTVVQLTSPMKFLMLFLPRESIFKFSIKNKIK